MALDSNYSDIILISISSVLNTSSQDTYIHFHILGLNFGFEDIKKIKDLRKLNSRVEFIFYNANQVEYDFPEAREQKNGLVNYAKILIPQILNNTNRVIILDSDHFIA